MGNPIKQFRFKEINDECNWKKELQDLYWNLSDYSHNKGQLKGYRELNNPTLFTSGTSAPSIKHATLELFCNLYIETVKEIVTVLSLYNPIIIVGVPFEEKYGLEGPMSGFLNHGQSEEVNKLIPKKYRIFFNTLIEKDEEIKSLIEYFDSLPDLTENDLMEQAIRQDEFIDKLKKPNNKPPT